MGVGADSAAVEAHWLVHVDRRVRVRSRFILAQRFALKPLRPLDQASNRIRQRCVLSFVQRVSLISCITVRYRLMPTSHLHCCNFSSSKYESQLFVRARQKEAASNASSRVKMRSTTHVAEHMTPTKWLGDALPALHRQICLTWRNRRRIKPRQVAKRLFFVISTVSLGIFGCHEANQRFKNMVGSFALLYVRIKISVNHPRKSSTLLILYLFIFSPPDS